MSGVGEEMDDDGEYGPSNAKKSNKLLLLSLKLAYFSICFQ